MLFQNISVILARLLVIKCKEEKKKKETRKHFSVIKEVYQTYPFSLLVIGKRVRKLLQSIESSETVQMIEKCYRRFRGNRR